MDGRMDEARIKTDEAPGRDEMRRAQEVIQGTEEEVNRATREEGEETWLTLRCSCRLTEDEHFLLQMVHMSFLRVLPAEKTHTHARNEIGGKVKR